MYDNFDEIAEINENLTDLEKQEEIERIQTSIDMKYKPSKSSLIWNKTKSKGNVKAQSLRYRQRQKIKKEEERKKLASMGYVEENLKKQPKILISVKAIKIKQKVSKLDPTSESVLIKMRGQIKEEKDRKLKAKTEISEGEWKNFQAQQRAMGIESE